MVGWAGARQVFSRLSDLLFAEPASRLATKQKVRRHNVQNNAVDSEVGDGGKR